MTLQIEAVGITHRGAVRENNEDCIAIGFWVSQESMDAARRFENPLDLPFACLVADGMGGHNDGEKASLLVARSLARRLSAQGPGHIGPAARAVNAELYAQFKDQPELAGMGSTVVGLVAYQKRLAIFNVGDSRAYRVNEGKLVQLSIDDTATGNWKPGDEGERSTQLLQCFGGRNTFTDIEPNMHRESVSAGSTYLMCSDGLYETIPAEQMSALIGPDLVASAEALLKAALAARCRDNVTIALVRVNEAPAA